MKTIEIKGSVRKETGKKNTKKIRKAGQIPCVLYGGEKNIHFSAPENNFIHLVYTPHVYIVKLDIDGEIHKAVLKDMQFHPVSDDILHIDFLEISDDKPVVIEIPIKLNGVPKGVKEGGKLYTMMRKLRVSALPADLPDQMEIEVAHLDIGNSIYIEDLEFEKLELLNAKRSPVVMVRTTRAAKGMEMPEEEAEAAEATEGAEEKTEEPAKE